MEKYVVVNANDSVAMLQFERCFYDAFKSHTSQKLLRQIWNWNDEEQRISLKTPKSELMLFAWYNAQHEPLCYVAGARNPSFSQLQYYGFDIPVDSQNFGEVLTLFTINGKRSNGYALNNRFLKAFCKNYALKEGWKGLLATCAPGVLNGYLRWGWQLRDTIIFQGETRHLLRFDFAQLKSKTQKQSIFEEHHICYLKF